MYSKFEHVTDLNSSKYLNSNQSNHIRIGIIGGANVGKSSLFNLLISSSSPFLSHVDKELFTTTDIVSKTIHRVDERFDVLKDLMNPEVCYPSMITVMDTPAFYCDNDGNFHQLYDKTGLREVDILFQVIRGFDDENISHYKENYDFVRDWIDANNLMMFTDMITIEQRIVEIENHFSVEKSGQHLGFEMTTLLMAWKILVGYDRPANNPSISGFNKEFIRKGKPLRFHSWDTAAMEILQNYQLLTMKKILYILNMNERDYFRNSGLYIKQIENSMIVEMGTILPIAPISITFENKWKSMTSQNVQLYLLSNPSHFSNIRFLYKECHRILELITFYVFVNGILRSFCITKDVTVDNAASFLDVKLSRLFLKAEVVNFDDFKAYHGNLPKLIEDRKIYSQGRRYVINDGDIVDFKMKVK